MKIEIDQSGKIEQTSWPTVVAYSNGSRGSIYFPASEKRLILQYLRQKGKNHSFPILVFAALICILLDKFCVKKSVVVIDKEYIGNEMKIKDFIVARGYPPEQIHFELVGKKSSAHKHAIESYRSKCGELVRAADIVDVLFLSKKKDQT